MTQKTLVKLSTKDAEGGGEIAKLGFQNLKKYDRKSCTTSISSQEVFNKKAPWATVR